VANRIEDVVEESHVIWSQLVDNSFANVSGALTAHVNETPAELAKDAWNTVNNAISSVTRYCDGDLLPGGHTFRPLEVWKPKLKMTASARLHYTFARKSKGYTISDVS
jgi:hypothetical protein